MDLPHVPAKRGPKKKVAFDSVKREKKSGSDLSAFGSTQHNSNAFSDIL